MTRITVHERVFERHPSLKEANVEAAWRNAMAMHTRRYGPPDVIAAAGMDTRGRMLELLGIELADGSVLVYHAMKLADKMARELDL